MLPPSDISFIGPQRNMKSSVKSTDQHADDPGSVLPEGHQDLSDIRNWDEAGTLEYKSKHSPREAKQISPLPTQQNVEGHNSGSLTCYVGLDRLLYVVGFLCQIGIGAALPLMTLIFGSNVSAFNMVSQASGPDDFESTINRFALYFVYLAIARFSLTYTGFLCINVAATRTIRTIRISLFEHTLRREMQYFDGMNNGSIATQIATNGHMIHQGISEKLGLLVQGVSLLISAFAVALSVQWKLALIVMSTLPAIVMIAGAATTAIVGNESKIILLHSAAAVIAEDALSSIRTIRAFSAESKFVQRYDAKLEEARRLGCKQSPIFGALSAGLIFIALSATALAFWQGHRMFKSGEIDNVGTVMTVVLSMALGATSLITTAPHLQAISKAASAAAELFSVLDTKSRLDPLDPGGKRPMSSHGSIEFRGVSFSYPSRPSLQVLRDLTLHAPPGKITAIVGASGSGKSTIIAILERWYEPDVGQVLIDGVDVRNLNTKWLRSQIGLVQQGPALFSGTIYENIAKGLTSSQLELSEERKMELVRRACMQANAHSFVEQLAEGYQTYVGQGTSSLSGGEIQRLAIARSIISSPKILLLDEATSALDSRSEQLVQDALRQVSAGRTTIIIAHKLSTVKMAHNIALISSGRIVEQGTHKELIAYGGRYAQMIAAQNLIGLRKPEIDTTASELPILKKHCTFDPLSTEDHKPDTDAEAVHLGPDTSSRSLPSSIFKLLYEQKDHYVYFIGSTFLALVAGGVYPSMAIILSRLLDAFAMEKSAEQDQVDFWVLMLFVLALVGFVAYFGIGFLSSEISQNIIRRYRREMLERVINFDQEFFDRPENSSGILTARLSAVPAALQELLSANFIRLVTVVISVMSSSILAVLCGWKLGLVLAGGGMPLLIASGYCRIRLEHKLEQDAATRFARSAGFAAEAITLIRTVSSLNLEQQILKEYSGQLQTILTRSLRNLGAILVPYALSQSLEFCVQAFGFWYGSRLVQGNEYTTSQFFVIFIAITFGGQSAGELFGYTTSMTRAKVAANYIFWLRTIKPVIRETVENENIGPSDMGQIKFENVQFRYSTRGSANVLKGTNLQVKPKTYLGVTGASGSGKSTLLALLQRFYDPTSGEITFGGDDIKKMSPRLYRSGWSLVEQMPPIYRMSVRENITFGLDYEASEEEVQAACQQANALDFISSLPQGLETPCGPKGVQFSGGQQQRIAVARALIRKPKVLILDEATSALDPQSERILQDTLHHAATNRTTIAIAHRLSTIRDANIIHVLEDGEIVESGTHAELLALRGRYFTLSLAQSLE